MCGAVGRWSAGWGRRRGRVEGQAASADAELDGAPAGGAPVGGFPPDPEPVGGVPEGALVPAGGGPNPVTVLTTVNVESSSTVT